MEAYTLFIIKILWLILSIFVQNNQEHFAFESTLKTHIAIFIHQMVKPKFSEI